MSQKTSLLSSTSPPRETPKSRSASEIEKRSAEETARLEELRQRLVAIEQERARRLESDSDITGADLSEINSRASALAEQIKSGEELAAALAGQLDQACEREWAERKTRRRGDLQKRAAAADVLYEQLARELAAFEKTLCTLKGLDREIESFNQTSNESVGFVARPEQRIRGASRPLWDDLAHVRRVYPADGFIRIDVPPNLLVEERRPKPPAPPKIEKRPPLQPVRFFSTRPPQAEEPPVEERAPSLLRTVHRAAAD